MFLSLCLTLVWGWGHFLLSGPLVFLGWWSVLENCLTGAKVGRNHHKILTYHQCAGNGNTNVFVILDFMFKPPHSLLKHKFWNREGKTCVKLNQIIIIKLNNELYNFFFFNQHLEVQDLHLRMDWKYALILWHFIWYCRCRLRPPTRSDLPNMVY